MNLSNISQIRINGSEVALMKFNGAILYENNRIPLYKVGMFRDSDITEAKTIVNTSHTDLSYMFNDCVCLTSVNTTDWDTSNVAVMNKMFRACISLTELDVSSFDTSNVTTMQAMFSSCNSLTSLDVSNFNTSNVTDMDSMFFSCESLTSLDLSNFDTSNVTTMSNMFSYCNALAELHLGYYWDMSKVTDTSSMFYNCKKLYVLNLQDCSKDTITKIITSEGFPTGKVDVSGAGTITRKIWCRQIDAPDESLLPDDWEFIFVDVG
jgi:surface protein